MPAPRLLAVMFLVAVFGGLTGALVTLALAGGDEDERGAIVRVQPEALLHNDMQVSCSEYHRFCIPQFDAPEDARAFYLGDTHDHFRNAGCFIEWRPDFEVSSYTLPAGEPETGAFRGICSGSTFLRDGTRIFGPSPRNLDEFPVTFTTETVQSSSGPLEFEYLEVDTRTLICGAYSGESPDTPCELAPPFD